MVHHVHQRSNRFWLRRLDISPYDRGSHYLGESFACGMAYLPGTWRDSTLKLIMAANKARGTGGVQPRDDEKHKNAVVACNQVRSSVVNDTTKC